MPPANERIRSEEGTSSSVSRTTTPEERSPKSATLHLAETKKITTTMKYIEFLSEFHHWANRQKTDREEDLHKAEEAIDSLRKQYEQEVTEGDPHQEETEELIETAEENLARVIEFNEKQMAKIENAVRKVEKSAKEDIDGAISEHGKLKSQIFRIKQLFIRKTRRNWEGVVRLIR